MPSNTKKYTRAYEAEHYEERYAKKKKRIIASTKARRIMEKKVWKAAIKWKDIDHIKPQAKWWKTVKSNLRIVSPKNNRSKWGKLKDKMYNR